MKMIYGTAWKEDRTEGLVTLALEAGFRHFDTANQRKHYFEEGVGRALAAAITSKKVSRSELFIQTKFTYVRGQDHRLPYNEHAPIAEQVRQSFASSLEHLKTDYIDSYLIHGPERSEVLTKTDWTVWGVMEELFDEGKIKHLGISNVGSAQLEELIKTARIKPTYVQNRCYPSVQWNRSVREVCKRYGVSYQAFNLIVDPQVWKSPEVKAIADRLGATIAQVAYRYAFQAGMIPMTGTTKQAHMKQALLGLDLQLNTAEMSQIEHLNG